MWIQLTESKGLTGSLDVYFNADFSTLEYDESAYAHQDIIKYRSSIPKRCQCEDQRIFNMSCSYRNMDAIWLGQLFDDADGHIEYYTFFFGLCFSMWVSMLSLCVHRMRRQRLCGVLIQFIKGLNANRGERRHEAFQTNRVKQLKTTGRPWTDI